jgi:hypothetical protein
MNKHIEQMSSKQFDQYMHNLIEHRGSALSPTRQGHRGVRKRDQLYHGGGHEYDRDVLRVNLSWLRASFVLAWYTTPSLVCVVVIGSLSL